MMHDLLEEKRKKLEMTQEEVAERAGITRAYYTMIEAGKKTPSPAIAKKIANSFGFDWTLFFAS